MSHVSNSGLFERAADLIDDFQSHPSGLDDQLIKALDSNDLQEIYRLVHVMEGLQAQEHFKGWDIKVW